MNTGLTSRFVQCETSNFQCYKCRKTDKSKHDIEEAHYQGAGVAGFVNTGLSPY